MPAIGQQLKKNILVEEREFMRMERKLKKIGPQADGDGGQRGQMKITYYSLITTKPN